MTSTRTEKDNIDLKQFNQVFFEECAEHLAEMEQILISLADRQPDHEQMNAIFRAAHSIKGGAGIFGFDDMTVVTHVMESLLDRLRKDQIAFRPAMIDLFLEAGDVISMQLSGHRDGTAVRQEAIDAVRQKLQRCIDGDLEQAQLQPAEPVPQGWSAPTSQPAETDRPFAKRYHLEFTPEPDIFRRGIRVESIIAELCELAQPGQFSCRAVLAEPPELEQFDPESCITRWHCTFATAASRQDIVDVFMFVADEEQLVIRELPPEPDDLEIAALIAKETDKAPEGALTGGAGPVPEPELTGGGQPAPPQQREQVPPALSASAGRRAYDNDELTPGAFGRRQSEADSSIRVNVTKVDQLINQVGELLITQAMLVQIMAGLDPVQYDRLHQTVAQLERNSRDLQGSVMSIRLVPIGLVFSRFPRLVRELAARLGKSVELKTVGESTELDKGLIEKIADPLAHLVRNALDHGLESTEVRLAQGKDATGTLQLKASQVGGRILIEVSDDGAGLNRGRILAKAAERGIACSEAMSDDEVWQLIFTPGFSTAESVTDLSGRGVGMDVVLKNVQSIGGRVQVASQAGRGSCISISLPLTLAIQNGLSVAVGPEKFIIPLGAITESLQPKPEQLKSVNGRELVAVRGDYLPILRLHELFDIRTAARQPQRAILVLVELDGEKAALLVDALLDEQQVVVKSLETNYRKVPGSAGATILGDGRVALILEVAELLAMHKKSQLNATANHNRKEAAAHADQPAK